VIIILLSSSSSSSSLSLSLFFSQTKNINYTGGAMPISQEEYEKLPKVNWDTLDKYSNPSVFLERALNGTVTLVTPPIGDQGANIGSCVGWAVGYTALGILTYPTPLQLSGQI